MFEDIQVTVKLFAAYQEAYGTETLTLMIPAGTTAGEVGDRLRAEHPELASLAAVTRYGINLDFKPADTPLANGDELVLIPPVSGG